MLLSLVAACSDNPEENGGNGDDKKGGSSSVIDIGARPVFDIPPRERPQELFSELQGIYMKIAPYGSGLFVYASTTDEPDNQRLLFCDIEAGSITAPYALPENFIPYDMIALSNGSLLVAGHFVRYNNIGAIEWIDDQFHIYQITNESTKRIVEGPEYASLGLFNTLAIDEKNECLYVLVNTSVLAYSLSGELLFDIEADGFIQDIIYSEYTDILYAMIVDGSDMSIMAFDENKGKFQELTRIQGGSIGVMIHKSNTHCFFVQQQSVISGFDKASNSFVEIFHLSAQGISGWVPFLCQYMEYFIVLVDDIAARTVKMQKIKIVDEYDGLVEVVKLGKFSIGIDLFLDALIADFNFLNPQYLIQIVDYSAYDEEAISMLHMDIIRGDAPDMFLLTDPDIQSNILPIRHYISSGILLNIAPYMERDLNFDDMLISAMNALYIDNACYFAVPSFTMRAMVGRSNVINEINYTNLNSFFEFLKSDFSKDDPKFIFTSSQSKFVVDFVLSNINQFADYTKGEAYFNSEIFITLLEAAKELKPIEGWDVAHFSRGSGQMAVFDFDIFGRLASYGAALNNDFEVMGFLGEPAGVALVPGHIFGISAATNNKEAAWAFLRELYENENLHENRNARFSMNKASHERSSEIYININSKYIDENEEGYYLSGEDFGFFIPHVDPKEIVNSTNFLIEQIDRIYIVDDAIVNIITEELTAFFAGNRTAEDTARVIQGRAQTYIWELT